MPDQQMTLEECIELSAREDGPRTPSLTFAPGVTIRWGRFEGAVEAVYPRQSRGPTLKVRIAGPKDNLVEEPGGAGPASEAALVELSPVRVPGL